jgi:hypothetical protein
MLPASLVQVLNATGTGETLPQWQVFINQSSVTATLIWSIAPAPVGSHTSPDQVKVTPHPTSESPPPHRTRKSPSSRRRDRRRREKWRACRHSRHPAHQSPEDLDALNTARSIPTSAAVAVTLSTPVLDPPTHPIKQDAGPDSPTVTFIWSGDV